MTLLFARSNSAGKKPFFLSQEVFQGAVTESCVLQDDTFLLAAAEKSKRNAINKRDFHFLSLSLWKGRDEDEDEVNEIEDGQSGQKRANRLRLSVGGTKNRPS